MTANSDSGIPNFEREFLGARETFTRIGAGQIGGKASGLELVRSEILPRYAENPVDGITVEIPTLTILTTAVFDSFMERNGLAAVVEAGLPDDRLAHAFQAAHLPAEHVGDLWALIRSVHQPLAVRSSSLLEDALNHPFAGVYGTKMIPNNQTDIEARFQRLVEAIKFVYASTYFRGARLYQQSVGQPASAEKMAVIIQEVVGERHSDRFYPLVSAVARSYNYYPAGNARPEDGVVSVALGLGKQIVDGGQAWNYAPPFPKTPPPYKDLRDLLRNTQVSFWAVHMGRPPKPDPIRETEYLQQHSLAVAEKDGALKFLASTYDAQSDRLRPGLAGRGPRVLTFAPLLSGEIVPFNEAVRRLLAISEKVVGAPVEIELAMNLDRQHGLPARLGFLQVRPMVVSEEMVELQAEDLAGPRVLVASDSALGNGERSDLSDIVYLRPETFDAARTTQMARELEVVNGRLAAEDRHCILIGFGRWGSADPWLGVPVEWPQIGAARVIVETTLPAMNPDLSQGSHFFHNLISFRVLYLSLRHDGPYRVDWEWLEHLPAVTETQFVRHVRSERPLVVRVDGRSRRGVILKPG